MLIITGIMRLQFSCSTHTCSLT